ncbi:hypothetical protein [Halobellus rufus]|uniref:hypothetical protein n=1 Tax=Halobellus rufus TaxID=1448860 RepID=UPI00067944B2|nr:hypothetical protein [Halobellus rufus]
MTNVPGLGLVAVLAMIAVLLALPLLAAVSLLAARATGIRIEFTLLGTNALAIVCGVAVAVASPLGLQEVSLGALVGLAKFTAGVLAAGLFVSAVFEGLPIATGAALTVVFREVSWSHALQYATAGYAVGGLGGAVAGLLLTGAAEAAALGALLSVPGALGSVLLAVAVSQLRRQRAMSAS